MSADEPPIDDLVAAVAEGRPIDWNAWLEAHRDEDNRRLVAQLRVLAEIARTATLPTEDSLQRDPAPDRSGSTSAPAHWGQFEIAEELGRGAFGRVYRAVDTRLDREVALKLFDRTLTGAGRLVREAQLLARIRHPHVVAVHTTDSVDGVTGIIMELIRGRTLQAIVREQGAFGPREAVLIGLDLCAALAAVHSAGLVHRDIKANNVMRETGGRIVLMDFGAGMQLGAVHDNAGVSTGTPLYMAPELLTGAVASTSTDLYALGALLFHLVSGRYPIEASSFRDLREKHARDARRLVRDLRPDVPAALGQVIDRALHPSPEARFRSAAQMERALAGALDVDRGPAAVGDTSSWRRWASRPIPAWAVLCLAPVLVAGTLLMVRTVDSSRTPANDAATVPVAAAGGDIPRDRRPLSLAQWSILESYQELAGSLAENGDWAGAAGHYLKGADLLLAEGWQDDPYRAHLMAKLGWAQIRGGQLDAGRNNLDLALYKLAQEAGEDHPLRATISMAVAEERYLRGDVPGAATAMLEAIRIRRAALASACDVTGPAAPDAERLIAALAAGPPSLDQDGDWIPDAIERAVGLDPDAVDSDGDGTLDDEGVMDGAVIPNGLAWAIVADPASVLAHFADLDPERAGWRRERHFTGQAAPPSPTRPRAWRMTVDKQGHYFQRLTLSQWRQTHARGWRLLSCGAVWTGTGGVILDPPAPGRRFDQGFFARSDGRAWLLLPTSIVPMEGPWFELGPRGNWPATESVFEPGRGVRVQSGARRHQGYAGHPQFAEGFGVIFSAANVMGAAPRGELDYSLVLFQIR